MAKTSAEKVRAFRERQRKTKARETRAPQGHTLGDLFRTPFFEKFENYGAHSEFEQAFDLMGMEPPEFEDDSGPKSFTGLLEESLDPDWRLFPEGANSLDRAEVMIGALLDGAVALATMVNYYKRNEVQARIDEISAELQESEEGRKEAIEQIVALTKLIEQLEKTVRWTVPQWKVQID